VSLPRSPSSSIGYDRLQGLVFLVVLPTANALLTSAFVLNLEIRDPWVPLAAALRIWASFGLSLVLLRLLARAAPKLFEDDHFWRQLLVHSVLVIGAGWLFGPYVDLPAPVPQPKLLLAPKVIVVLELAMYLAVVRILKQQERAFATEASLREAELQVLRSQSNPHFLFNTLNLIASEIPRDPDNAREIVFDLADLLRSTIKVAEKKLTTVAEEMELVRLYLKLQQQRFSDRLEFSMEIAPETKNLEIPALLLQPVVENSVKWAVAPYAARARIHIECRLQDDGLMIVVSDTGPGFDDAQVVEGHGLRILRRTLELNYPGRWHLSSSPTDDGGVLSLRLPRREHTPA
jgi:signal transduction histidine kinase